MNAEQLNIIARGILQLTGLSPEEIDLQVKQQNKQKTRDSLKSQPRQIAPKLPKTPPVKPQAPVDPKSLTAEQIYGKGRVNRSVNTARNMNPTAGLSGFGKARAGVGNVLASLLIDPVTDAISDNVSRPILEALTGTQIPDSKNIREKGPQKAAEDLKASQPAPAPVSTTGGQKPRSVANIPPAEAQPGSPSYVAPAALPAADNSTAAPSPTSSTKAPAAPVRPDYNSMSELERLKIWAMTNRKMIESVGTRQQLQILQQALGGGTN